MGNTIKGTNKSKRSSYDTEMTMFSPEVDTENLSLSINGVITEIASYIVDCINLARCRAGIYELNGRTEEEMWCDIRGYKRNDPLFKALYINIEKIKKQNDEAQKEKKYILTDKLWEDLFVNKIEIACSENKVSMASYLVKNIVTKKLDGIATTVGEILDKNFVSMGGWSVEEIEYSFEHQINFLNNICKRLGVKAHLENFQDRVLKEIDFQAHQQKLSHSFSN